MSRNSKDGKQSTRKVGLSKSEIIAIPVIILIAIWVVYSVMQPAPPATQQTSTSSPTQTGGAPEFTLPIVNANGLTGQTVTLSSFRGKVVLLEFMEPWCIHCQHMAPILDSLHTQYGASVVFLSVAGPWNGATASDAAKFIQTYGTSWTYVYDSSGTVMGNVYGVTATPTFFLIGKSGSIVTSLQGEQTADALSAAVTQASSA